MHTYTNEYSKFPTAVITPSNYEDATDAVADMLNTIKQYQNNGQYHAAAAYAEKNKEFLETHLVGADTLMKLQEEIRNTQIYGLLKGQSIYIQDDEPSVIGCLDTWIGK